MNKKTLGQSQREVKKIFNKAKRRISMSNRMMNRTLGVIDSNKLKHSIKSFGFQNFKIFKNHNSIDIGKLNVLEGENGAGKSSVYEVLKILAQTLSGSQDTSNLLDTSGFLKKWNQSSEIIYNNSSKNDLSFDFDIVRDFGFEKLGNGPEYNKLKKTVATKFSVNWIEQNFLKITKIMSSNPVSYYILLLFAFDLTKNRNSSYNYTVNFDKPGEIPVLVLDIKSFREKLLQNITTGKKIQKEFKTYFRNRKNDLTITVSLDKHKKSSFLLDKKSIYKKSDINKLSEDHLVEAMEVFKSDLFKLNQTIVFESKGLLDNKALKFGCLTASEFNPLSTYLLSAPETNIVLFNNEKIYSPTGDLDRFADNALIGFDLLPFIIKCIEIEKIDKETKIHKLKTFDEVIRKVIGKAKDTSARRKYYEYSLDLKIKFYFELVHTSTVEELKISGVTLVNNATSQKLIELTTASRIEKTDKNYWKDLLKSKKYFGTVAPADMKSEEINVFENNIRTPDELKSFIKVAKEQNYLIINNLFKHKDSSNFWEILVHFYNNLIGEGYSSFFPNGLKSEDIKSGKNLLDLCNVSNVAFNYTLLRGATSGFYATQQVGDRNLNNSQVFNPNYYNKSEMIFNNIITRLQSKFNNELPTEIDRKYRGRVRGRDGGLVPLLNTYFSSINPFIRSTLFIDNVAFSGEEKNYSFSAQKNNLINHASGSGKDFTIDNILTYCYQNPNTLKLLNQWLIKIKLNFEIEIIKVSQSPFILRGAVTDTVSKIKNIDLNHIGFGAYQAIRLIFILISFENKLIFLTEPEQNLHPKVHTRFAELMEYSIINNNNKIFVETHSEILTLKILKMAKESKLLSPNDIKINIVKRKQKESEVVPVKLDEKGKILNSWPGGFFPHKYDL